MLTVLTHETNVTLYKGKTAVGNKLSISYVSPLSISLTHEGHCEQSNGITAIYTQKVRTLIRGFMAEGKSANCLQII